MLPIFLSLLIILSPFISTIECSLENPTAIFVFGDSLSDPGNNRLFSAYYSPYGIDFPQGTTGRWTNGLIFADLIASEVGLPFPAAYRKEPRSLTGYNYASGGCGILPNNDTSIFACMGLDIQINNFNKTIVEELVQVFNPTELNEYLSKSIFIIWAGTNDYFLNYFKNLSPNYTSEEYAHLLVDTLSNYLKVLHSLGARKFLVLELGPIGCVPFNRLNGGHDGTWCDESKNKNATIFNERLATMLLQNLSSTYLDSHFILGKTYDLSDDAFRNPSKYGLINVTHPCCTVGPSLLSNISCLPWFLGKVCDTRDQYLFFDGVHPTEASLRVLASRCFNDSGVCVPYNIQQLIQLQTNSYKSLKNNNNNSVYNIATSSVQLHGVA